MFILLSETGIPLTAGLSGVDGKCLVVFSEYDRAKEYNDQLRYIKDELANMKVVETNARSIRLNVEMIENYTWNQLYVCWNPVMESTILTCDLVHVDQLKSNRR